MEHPKFRAAFDLLSLRAEVERNRGATAPRRSGGENFRSLHHQSRKDMLTDLDDEPAPRRRHRRPRKRAPRREGTA